MVYTCLFGQRANLDLMFGILACSLDRVNDTSDGWLEEQSHVRPAKFQLAESDTRFRVVIPR